MHNEIQEVLGQSFAVPDGLDEDDLLEELDALEDEMANEVETGSRAGVPSYLQVNPLPCAYYHTRVSQVLDFSCTSALWGGRIWSLMFGILMPFQGWGNRIVMFRESSSLRP